MHVLELVYRNLRALPLLTRLIGVPVLVLVVFIALRSVLTMPVWQVLVGIAGGAVLYAVTDLKVPGYRVLLALGVVGMVWTLVPFLVTYLALFAVVEPGAVAHWIRGIRSTAPSSA